MRFRTKTILGVAAIEMVMLAVLVGSVLSVLRDSNTQELERRIKLGSQLLAAAAKDAVIAEDLATLDSLLDETFATGQVAYVRILDGRRKVMTQRGEATALARPFNHETPLNIEDGVYEWAVPIEVSGARYGEVQMGVATGPLRALLLSSQSWAAVIAGLEMVLVAIFSWLLGSYLARQLVALREASEGIASGDFSGRIPVHGDDELAQTAQAFNRMAEQLGASHAIITEEIRARTQLQEALKQALGSAEERSRQLNEIFALLPDGLISFDRSGMVKYATPAILNMLGVAESEVIGRWQAELEEALRERLVTPGQWSGLDQCFIASTAPPQRCLLSLRRPQARVIELLGIESHTESLSRLLYLRDVTHEIEVDEMKSEFLAHAAHELRTPMASIYGYSELLISQQFDPETQRSMLQTIYKQTAWLVEIINELLDLSRIEARRGKDFNIEDVALAPLLTELLAVMKIDPAHWPLSVDVPGDLPPVRADVAKLRQVLTNVLGNAVKYSPEGGPITIRAASHDKSGKPLVSLAIADRGIGMTPEQAARVCERFYRANSSGQIPGSGLGMSIAKEVIELLGGHLDIESQPGLGTTVTLWLPARAQC